MDPEEEVNPQGTSEQDETLEPESPTSEEAPEAEGPEGQPEAEGEETAQFETTDELAEALGMGPEDFYGSIRTTVKVNGQERNVTLAELKSGFSMESDYRQKTADLAESRKKLEAEQQAIQTEWQNTQQQLAGVIQYLQSEIPSQEQLDRLLEDDPSEYQRAKAKADRAHAAIQQAIQTAQQHQQTQMQQYLQKEQQALRDALPEMREADKAKQFVGEISGYLRDEGFSDAEIANAADHRMILIARKAMLYDRLQKAKPETQKRLKQLPKVQKPGAARSKADVAAEQRTAKMKRYKQTGSDQDLVGVFADFVGDI